MEHRVLGKSVLCVVLLLCPRDFRHWPVWLQTLRDDHILNTTYSAISLYSTILMYKFALIPGRLLWQSKLQNHGGLLYRIIYVLSIFSRPFDLAKSDSVVDMTRYTETLYRG